MKTEYNFIATRLYSEPWHKDESYVAKCDSSPEIIKQLKLVEKSISENFENCPTVSGDFRAFTIYAGDSVDNLECIHTSGLREEEVFTEVMDLHELVKEHAVSPAPL